ncbi:MAG: ThiS family protein [Firmicutes bacterium ADurb.Bin080]|jgi:molybdopterin converting factor small subunit|nr:MoaD/ThiS family protein [Clostridiales bacterium]OQC14044.1 MAG: ThiS family protein [Firmicutes bacterium ADurb.Bin080]
MIKVEFFGLYRLNYKMSSWETEASDINNLLKNLSEYNSYYSYKELKDSIILINGKNIMDLRRFRTRLKDGDNVLIMSPASGG